MRGVWWFGVVVLALAAAALALRFARRPLAYHRTVPEDDSFGASGEGFHSWHIGGVAVGDTLLTVALAAVFAVLSNGPFVFWLGVSLFVGEAMHIVFGVRTATYVWLFDDQQLLLDGNASSTRELRTVYVG